MRGPLSASLPNLKPICSRSTPGLKRLTYFCSVYLMKPANNLNAMKLFQYRHLIRNLMERGGDWRGYDESFRTMRTVEGWNWDEMHSQVWLMAAQRPVPKVAPQVKAPFLARGASPRVVPGHCTRYNTQGSCPFNPCRFRHQCSLCGGGAILQSNVMPKNVSHSAVNGGGGEGFRS